jgi:hypothetical protein
MNRDEIIIAIQLAAKDKTPAEVATLLGSLVEGGLNDWWFVWYFRRAFKVPLRTLKGLARWSGLGGTLSDEEFNAELGPWLSGQRSE